MKLIALPLLLVLSSGAVAQRTNCDLYTVADTAELLSQIDVQINQESGSANVTAESKHDEFRLISDGDLVTLVQDNPAGRIEVHLMTNPEFSFLQQYVDFVANDYGFTAEDKKAFAEGVFAKLGHLNINGCFVGGGDLKAFASRENLDWSTPSTPNEIPACQIQEPREVGSTMARVSERDGSTVNEAHVQILLERISALDGLEFRMDQAQDITGSGPRHLPALVLSRSGFGGWQFEEIGYCKNFHREPMPEASLGDAEPNLHLRVLVETEVAFEGKVDATKKSKHSDRKGHWQQRRQDD